MCFQLRLCSAREEVLMTLKLLHTEIRVVFRRDWRWTFLTLKLFVIWKLPKLADDKFDFSSTISALLFSSPVGRSLISFSSAIPVGVLNFRFTLSIFQKGLFCVWLTGGTMKTGSTCLSLERRRKNPEIWKKSGLLAKHGSQLDESQYWYSAKLSASFCRVLLSRS